MITIPSTAVIFNQEGLRAAVLSDGKVELRKIEIDVDNGANVDDRSGLKDGDRIILSPPANGRTMKDRSLEAGATQIP